MNGKLRGNLMLLDARVDLRHRSMRWISTRVDFSERRSERTSFFSIRFTILQLTSPFPSPLSTPSQSPARSTITPKSARLSKTYGFYTECLRKYNSAAVWTYFTDMFDFLTLSVVIDDRIFCVHGGECRISFIARCRLHAESYQRALRG